MISINRDKFGPWAVITGASSGIGEAFARQIAANGINVVLVARRGALLEQLGAELAAKHRIQYRAVCMDLTQPDFLDLLRDATHDLDVGLLVSNAGAVVPGEFLTVERDDLLSSIQLKVVAHLKLAHHFGRRMAKRGRGGLLLVSSTGGLQGIPFIANNAATEAYVLSLGEGLHIELAKHGVTVTVLMPGPTDTPAVAQQGIRIEDFPVKPMSARQVVSEGLQALDANRATHIAGLMNRIMAALLPRSMATRLNGQMIGKLFARALSS